MPGERIEENNVKEEEAVIEKVERERNGERKIMYPRAHLE
jgi:hypothetical protein